MIEKQLQILLHKIIIQEQPKLVIRLQKEKAIGLQVLAGAIKFLIQNKYILVSYF